MVIITYQNHVSAYIEKTKLSQTENPLGKKLKPKPHRSIKIVIIENKSSIGPDLPRPKKETKEKRKGKETKETQKKERKEK